MDGPSHYKEAEKLAAHARKLLSQGDTRAAAWAAIAQVHATVALASATAAGTPWEKAATATPVNIVFEEQLRDPPR